MISRAATRIWWARGLTAEEAPASPQGMGSGLTGAPHHGPRALYSQAACAGGESCCVHGLLALYSVWSMVLPASLVVVADACSEQYQLLHMTQSQGSQLQHGAPRRRGSMHEQPTSHSASEQGVWRGRTRDISAAGLLGPGIGQGATEDATESPVPAPPLPGTSRTGAGPGRALSCMPGAQ